MCNDIETFFVLLRGRAKRSILIMNIYVNAFELKGLQIKENLATFFLLMQIQKTIWNEIDFELQLTLPSLSR